MGIKTQKKITLTENQSSSEVTKGRSTWEKDGAYLPYIDSKRKTTTMKTYIAQDYLSYQELIYTYKLHFQSVGRTEYTV